MELPDHLLELSDGGAGLGLGGIGGVRCEEGDGLVAPQVEQARAQQRVVAIGVGLFEFVDGQQFDGGDAEVLKVGDLLGKAEIGARRGDAGGGVPREASDVHLVDDRVFERAVQGPVVPPLKAERIEGAMAFRRVGTPLFAARDDTGVGVEQITGGVVAVDMRRRVGPHVHAPGILEAVVEAGQPDMPEVAGSVVGRVEREFLERLLFASSEQRKRDICGVARVDGEIDASGQTRCAHRQTDTAVDTEYPSHMPPIQSSNVPRRWRSGPLGRPGLIPHKVCR